jgi:DNA-binding MarR family transcriptional regulator
MSGPSVYVPIGLLHDSRLTYSDMVLWMVMRLDANDNTITNVYSQSRLARRLGLARGTVINGMKRLAKAGWYDPEKPTAVVNRYVDSEKWLKISGELFTRENLRPRDIVIFCLLMGRGARNNQPATLRELAEYAHACPKTVSRAIKALQEDEWIIVIRVYKTAPGKYQLDSPSARNYRKWYNRTDNRLKRPSGHGEAIAQAMVALVAAPADFSANTRLSFLSNPDTDEFLEVDMWFPEYNLAVEFNGRQHYAPTEFASAEDVAKQQERDKVKAALLKAKKITLVVLTAADLSIDAVIRKLQGLVPLRDLRWHQALASYLNRIGKYYQQKTKRMQMQPQTT